MCDGVFSDEEDEVLEKSWKKRNEEINKDGYRAGIDVGQEESVQEGFDIAFAHAGKLLHMVSTLRGAVSCKLGYNLMKPGRLSADQEKLLQDLLGDIVEFEKEMSTFNKDFFTLLKESNVLSISSKQSNIQEEKLGIESRKLNKNIQHTVDHSMEAAGINRGKIESSTDKSENHSSSTADSSSELSNEISGLSNEIETDNPDLKNTKEDRDLSRKSCVNEIPTIQRIHVLQTRYNEIMNIRT